MGINTYCLRAMRWKDVQLIDYADGLKMDAVFLQDSLDPEAHESPPTGARFTTTSPRKKLHIETGTGAVLPRSAAEFEAKQKDLRTRLWSAPKPSGLRLSVACTPQTASICRPGPLNSTSKRPSNSFARCAVKPWTPG